MCKFFSCVSTGDGKPMYFDWELRKKVLSGELKNYEPDSHTSIADYFGYKAEKEDVLNKYEYNPLTKVFTIDQQNAKRKDHIKIHKWLEKVDWKTIAEPLIIKPTINPFKDRNITEATPEDIELVKKWDSIRASARDSIRVSAWDSVWASIKASARDSVGASVGDSAWDSVRVSAWDSVWASIRASVGASAWDSVWDSVRTSVGASAWAYISSYFSINYKYDFSSCIKLWEKGIVPSFDGKIWRLHGKDGKIIWEGKIGG